MGAKFSFKLNDTAYTVLKWITLTVIPVSATAYVGLSAIWGWPYADQIAKTSAVICAFLGGLLGISTAQYYKDESEPFDENKYWDDEEEKK